MRLDDGQIEIVDPVMVEVLRLKTGAERLRIAHGMWASTRARLDAYLRREHPDWDDEQINREILRRLLHGSS
ncbi:MAG: hypothetical protein M1602_03100 [Firmicutes bacterium]|nr:hypothetical protein [Bacillota bacterium]